MNILKIFSIILVFFFKTGNVLSKENIFNVNNIQIVKKSEISDNEYARQAILKGFRKLLEKILLETDKARISNVGFSEINQLVSHYQVLGTIEEDTVTKINYNIFFDKEKMHALFYKNNILYSEVLDKEVYLLPILKKNDQIYIYNKNFFYENWNNTYNNELIEFLLPIENIEIIQNANFNKENLNLLSLKDIFREYRNKNIALVLIEENKIVNEKIFLKTEILGKPINKTILVNGSKLNTVDHYKKIILNVSKEIENLVKSQNLIDVRTPSFLNTKLVLKNKNLYELNFRLKEIDLIDNIFVQAFNKDYVLLKIKYYGKLDKIIQQLKEVNIILKNISEEWSIEII